MYDGLAGTLLVRWLARGTLFREGYPDHVEPVLKTVACVIHVYDASCMYIMCHMCI